MTDGERIAAAIPEKTIERYIKLLKINNFFPGDNLRHIAIMGIVDTVWIIETLGGKVVWEKGEQR